MKKFSRTYKRWIALFLAFLMMAQPAVTSFAEVADGSVLSFAALEEEAVITEEDSASSEDTEAVPEDSGEAAADTSEESGEDADTGESSGDGEDVGAGDSAESDNEADDGDSAGNIDDAAEDGAAVEDMPEDAAGESEAEADDPEKASGDEKTESVLSGEVNPLSAGGNSGGGGSGGEVATASMYVKRFSNLPVYLGGEGSEEDEENRISEDGGTFEYETDGEPIQLRVCRISTGNWFYGVYIWSSEEGAHELRCNTGEDFYEDSGIKVETGDWIDTITIDPESYPEGFELELITEPMPEDGEFRVHMDEEYDQMPNVWYTTADPGFRVRNDAQGVETYEYVAGESTHTFRISSPLPDGTVYAADVRLRQDGEHTAVYYPSNLEGSDFVQQSDGSYLLTLFDDEDNFPETITGGFYLHIYWTEEDWNFHHYSVDYTTQRRIEVAQKSGDFGRCGLELANEGTGYHAFNREIYIISKYDTSVAFNIYNSSNYRFDHADVYADEDESVNFAWRSYDRGDLIDGQLVITAGEGEVLPSVLYVDHYYEEIPTEEAFTLGAVSIEGTAHEEFAEKELVLHLKEGFSWNSAVAGLSTGDDFSDYALLSSDQDKDDIDLTFESISGNELRLKAKGTVVWGYQDENIRICSNFGLENDLVYKDGEPVDGYVTNEENDEAVWNIAPLRVMTPSWNGSEADLPVRPGSDGMVSGRFYLVLDEGYRFADSLGAGDVNEGFGINLDDDLQTVTIEGVSSAEEGKNDRRKVSLNFSGTSYVSREDTIEFHFWNCVEKYDEEAETWNLIEGEVKSEFKDAYRWEIPAGSLGVAEGTDVTVEKNEETSISYTFTLPEDCPWVWNESYLALLKEWDQLSGYCFDLAGLDWNDYHLDEYEIDDAEEPGDRRKLTVFGTLNCDEDLDIPVVFKVRGVFRWAEDQAKAGESHDGELWTKAEEGEGEDKKTAPCIVVGDPHKFQVNGCSDEQFDLWRDSKTDENLLEPDTDYSFDPDAETLSIIVRKKNDVIFRGFYVYPNNSDTELYTIGSDKVTENETDTEYTLTLDPENYRSGFNVEVITYDLPYDGEIIPCFDTEKGTVSWNGTKDGSASEKNLNDENKVFFDAHKAQTLTITPGEGEGFYGVEVMYPSCAGSENNFSYVYGEDEEITETGGVYTVALFAEAESGEPEHGFWLHVYWNEDEYRFEHAKDRYYWDKQYQNYYYIDIQYNGGDGSLELKDAEAIGAELHSRWGNIRGLIPKKDENDQLRTSLEFTVESGKWSQPSVWINGTGYGNENIDDNGVLTYQIPTDDQGQYVDTIDVDYDFYEKDTRWLFYIEDTEVTGIAHSPIEEQYLTLTIPDEEGDEDYVWITGLTEGQDLSSVTEVETNNDINEFHLSFKEYKGESRKQIVVAINGTAYCGNGDDLRLIVKNLINEVRPVDGGAEGETEEVLLADQIRNWTNSKATWSMDNFRKITIQAGADGFTVERSADGKVRHNFTLTLDNGFRWIERDELQNRINSGRKICSNLYDKAGEIDRTETITVTSMSEDRKTITFTFVAETNFEQLNAVTFFCWDVVEEEIEGNWQPVTGEVATKRNEKIRFNVPVLKKMTLEGGTVEAALENDVSFTFDLTLEESLGWSWNEDVLAELKEDSNLYDAFSLEDYNGYYVFNDYSVSGRTLTLSGKLNSGDTQDIPVRIRAWNVFEKDGVRVYGELENEETAARIIIGDPHKFLIQGFDENKFKLWKGTEQTDDNLLWGGNELSYVSEGTGFAEQKFTVKTTSVYSVFRGVYLYPRKGDTEYYLVGSTGKVAVENKGNGVYEITVDPDDYRSGVELALITWEFPCGNEVVAQYDESKIQEKLVTWSGTRDGSSVDVALGNCEKTAFDAGTSQTVTIREYDGYTSESDPEFFYGIEVQYPEGSGADNFTVRKEQFTYNAGTKSWSYELFNTANQPAGGYYLQVYWAEQEYVYEHIYDDFDWDAYYLVDVGRCDNGYISYELSYCAAHGYRYDQSRYKVPKDKVSSFTFTITPDTWYQVNDLWINGNNLKDQLDENGRITYTPGENEGTINVDANFRELDFAGNLFKVADGTEISGTAGTELTQVITLEIPEDKTDLYWKEGLSNGDLLSGYNACMELESNNDEEYFQLTFDSYEGADRKKIRVKVQGTPLNGNGDELSLKVKDLIYRRSGETEIKVEGIIWSRGNSEARWNVNNFQILTISAGPEGFNVSPDAEGYLRHDFTLTAAAGYRFKTDLNEQQVQDNIGSSGAFSDREISEVTVAEDGSTLSFRFKGTSNYDMYTVIQFYVWNCVEKQNGESWELLSFEAATVWNDKIRWNNPAKKNLTLAGSSVTAACGEEKTFEYTLTIDEGLGWKWSEEYLEDAQDQLGNFFWLNDFDGLSEFTGYTLVNDREIRVQGKVKSGRDQDIPVSICAANLFTDGGGNRIWGNLYTKDQDVIRIVTGDPHKFKIDGYDNGSFRFWKGTEQDVDDNLLNGGDIINYVEKADGSFEVQKFTLRKEEADAEFRGIWLYPNNAESEFYPLGSEIIQDKGEGVYEITVDPNNYRSGVRLWLFTNELPYDGQFIPTFDETYRVSPSVTWTEEGGADEILSSGGYVDFDPDKAQTFTFTDTTGNGFYGIEVVYANPRNGEPNVFIKATDSRFTHDTEAHTWTIELFDGEDNKPVSGFWLHVYTVEEEYTYEHLTDADNWEDNYVLVTVGHQTRPETGNVTVEGRTGYTRYGKTRYLIPKTELAASGLVLSVVPAENYKMNYLGIGNQNYADQVKDGRLVYTWNGQDSQIWVWAPFSEDFEDLGEHITIWDTRITAKAGETYTAHLYLALDEDCEYTWAEEAPDGVGEAVRLNVPWNSMDAQITYWHVSEEDPKLLELWMTGVGNQLFTDVEITVEAVRGLLNASKEPVTGCVMSSHYNSNALWNITATTGMTIESGTSIHGVNGVFTDPQQFVLKLDEGYKWSENIRPLVNRNQSVGANRAEVNVEFVSVSADRTELTVRISGKSYSRGTEPIVFWAYSGSVVDEEGQTVEQILATRQEEDINWIITNRGGLTVENAFLNGRAHESRSHTITLKLDAESGLTFDADELSKADENKADIGNYISFNGNPLWWEFTDYQLVNERELRVTFDLNVPYARIHDPLNVYVNTIISGNDGQMLAEGEDAYWNIRAANLKFGLNGMESPTGIRYGETKSFSIDRDGYDGQISVVWSVTGEEFELNADGENASVTALAGESAEAGELKAVISYDYDEETHTYIGQETLTETLYVKRSFNYSGLEADVNVLEKSHTIHAEVENPLELTVNSVTWEVLPLANGETDTRITVAPIEETAGMEAVIAANATTGSSCAKVKVTVVYQAGGRTQTESYTASINVHDGEENTFKITYDPNGGTGIITTEHVKAGETASVRKLTCTKDSTVADYWTDEEGNIYWAYDTFVPESDLTLKAHWVVNGWNEEDGEWYYYRNGERVCDELVESRNALFWLNEEGRLVPNTRVELSGVPFCTDENGALVTNGWGLNIQGHITSPMYLNDVGVALGAFGEEQANIDGKTYDFENGLVWNDYVLNLQVGAEADEEADYIVYLLDGNPAGVTLPVPEKENFRFVGWFTEITGGTEVTDDDLATVKAHSRFYAHWTAVTEAEVTVIYKEQNPENPTEYVEVSTETFTGIVGEETDVQAPERDGFSAQDVEQKTILSKDTQVEVCYDRRAYSLSFNMEDSGFPAVEAETYLYGQAVSLPDEEDYQIEGKTFLGWYQNGERFQDGDAMPAFDLELKPLWAEDEGRWTWDGIGWKYAQPENLFGNNYAAEKLIGIPEEDPEFWYYVDEYGHMVQNYAVYLDGGTAAFAADGKRIYSGWITVPSARRDYLSDGQTMRTGYADRHGWLITDQLAEIGGVTYGFDSDGWMALGYTDEHFNILSGESCIDDSVYYFNKSSFTGTYGGMVTNEFVEVTEYHSEYETYEHIWLYFGNDGEKLKDESRTFSEGEDTVSCSFDAKGVLSSGVTVTYARGYESDRTATMDDRFVPVLPGMTGASLDGNLYDRPGYYFDRWKSADDTAYADGYYLSADEIKALYKTEGKKLELTAQWKPVQWKVELPELEHASIALSADSSRKTGTKVTFTITPDSGYHVDEETLKALELNWIGQEKRDTEDQPVPVSLTKESAVNTWSFTMPASNVRIDAEMEADTGVTYKVEYWYQGTDGKYYRNDEQTETFHDGVTGEVPPLSSRTTPRGFLPPTEPEYIPVAGDGSTVYKYEYSRQTLHLVLSKDDGIESVTGAAESIYFDQEVTVSAEAKTGYHMTGWSHKGALKATASSYTFHMPAEEDLTEEEGNVYELKAESQVNTYKVVFNKNSEEASGTMAEQSFTYGTAAELSTNTFERAGYTFSGWMKRADGTAADYSDGQSVNNLTAVHEGTVTLYALWEEGESTAYKVEHYKQNLADDDYTIADTDNRTGRTGSEVTPEVKSYTGFTAPEKQTKTILADGSLVVKYYYTRNSYELTLEKGTGIASVTGAETYRYGAEVTVSAAANEGYTFSSWTKGETVLSEDSSYTFHMPAEAFTLKAGAAANNYTVKFNGNGATAGSMENQSFTYDAEAKALTANAFTKTGYTFAGWALTAAGDVVYADGAEVRNLTKVKDGEFVLYAKWTANTYTVKYDGNGATAGSMTAGTFTYDAAAKALAANAFEKTGYHFAGWAESAEGEVKYADKAEVQNLTAAENGEVTLYAQWTANTYTVKFNGNGSAAGTMAAETFTYDAAAKALTANAFTKTGYHFAGWAESAEGEVKYADKAEVRNLTTENGGQIELFAKWTANAYTVKFNGNGATAGTMADESFIYDAEAKALTENAFTRTGYTFAGWAKTASGAVAYADKAAVQNLTAEEDGTVNLYAKWTANTYTVKFNAGTGSGTMEDQSFTYDEAAKALTANAFTKTGYHFAGWAETAEGEVAYADKASVQNLSSAENGEVTLYAKWTANSYTVRFSANGGIGTMADQSFTYDAEAKALTANSFSRTGYTFAGWALTAAGDVIYTDGSTVRNLTSVKDGEIVLYAKWTAHSYTVKFHAGTGSGTMDDQSFTYDEEAKALTASTFTKTGYTFAGWALTEGGAKKYTDSQKVQNLTAAAGGTVDLYAVWTANTYTVKFNGNGSTAGTMAGETFTYDGAEKALTANAFTRTGYTFAGWAETAGGAKKYENGQKVQNLTTEAGGTVNLYAVWTANTYTVKFNANTGSGEMADQPFTYDEEAKALTANAFTKTGYTFKGWAETASGTVKYADAAVVRNLTAVNGATVTLYAVWKANTWKVTFNANGGTGTMADESFVYDTQKALTSLGFSRQGYTFSKWTVDAAGEGQSYANRAKVKNLKAGEGETLVLYARWIPNEDTAYKVEHKLQNLAGTGYKLERTEGKYGTTDAQTEAKAKYYEGFEAQAITQADIAADGSTVVEVKYSRKQYEVTFLTDGTTYVTQNVKYEGTAVRPDDPEKENYTFVNWYADETYLEVWDFSENVITGATSIYAKFIPKTKHLTLDANGGTVAPAEKYVKFEGTYEELPVPARTGYGFAGWYTEAAGGTLVNNLTPVTDTASQTLYAHWESGKYTVSFNAGGGSVTGGSDTKLVEYDQTYGELPKAERKGYQFLGWFTESEGGTQITAATVVKITADQTLYALYAAINYSITYAGMDGAENTNPGSYTINDTVFFENPAKTGYVFAGWDMTIGGQSMGERMLMAYIRAGMTGKVVMTANWTKYEPKENKVEQSSSVEQKAKENEEVEKVVEEVKANGSAKKETENLEKALDAEALSDLGRQETGNTGKEVEKVEVHLEIRLENITVSSGSGEKKQTTLTFDVTPLADFKDGDGNPLAENVPVSDDVLNKEERFTFRIPIPASITAAYAKVKHTTEGGDTEESIHEIFTDAEGKYIKYSALTLSPFELSFTDTAYTVSDPGTYTYTGSEICPEVTVKEEATGTVLEEDRDYTVAYENNIEPGTAKAIVTILASGLTVEKEFTIKRKTSGGGSSGGSGGGSSAGVTVSIPSWVEKNGTWSQDANGNWIYTNGGVVYKDKWACVYNPYANTTAGQRAYDWFHFDGNGIMQTGWFTDTDGNVYYLNPVSDGTRGRMLTGWQQIEEKWYYFSTAEGSGTMGALSRNTTTPDGYKVDAKGVWIK